MQLSEYAGDSKKFWRVINTTFDATVTKYQNTISLCDPVTKLPISPSDCYNYINEFLDAAGPKLANDIPKIPLKSTFNGFLTNLKFNRILVEETVESYKPDMYFQILSH